MSSYSHGALPLHWQLTLNDGQQAVVEALNVTTNACGALVFYNGAGQVLRLVAAGRWHDVQLMQDRRGVSAAS